VHAADRGLSRGRLLKMLLIVDLVEVNPWSGRWKSLAPGLNSQGQNLRPRSRTVQLGVGLVVRGHPALEAVELGEDDRHLRLRFPSAALRAAALSAATALTFAATSTTALTTATTPTAPFSRSSNQVCCQLGGSGLREQFHQSLAVKPG
jgi:hypothetical protein